MPATLEFRLTSQEQRVTRESLCPFVQTCWSYIRISVFARCLWGQDFEGIKWVFAWSPAWIWICKVPRKLFTPFFYKELGFNQVCLMANWLLWWNCRISSWNLRKWDENGKEVPSRNQSNEDDSLASYDPLKYAEEMKEIEIGVRLPKSIWLRMQRRTAMTRYGSENAEPSLIENAKWDVMWQEIWTSIKFIEKITMNKL